MVYILECADQTLYVGSTNNIKKRLIAHNSLKSGARYTKARRPVTMIYTEFCETWGQALSREYQIKQLTREEKLALVRAFQYLMESSTL